VSLPAHAKSALQAGAVQLGVELDAGQMAALDRYVEVLLAWNGKINLTAVTDPMGIVDKHLLDCLALVPAVAGTRLLDVGTGPGLPAVVLAIARPELRITAIESIHKKVSFVRAVSRELRLPIEVEAMRLEQRDEEPDFDTAVSRATFEPAEWVERGAGFVKPGGHLIAMLSEQQTVPDAPTGFTPAEVTSHTLGGAVRRVAVYCRRP
jgi:16S rRNA (guanine527-N7)-methyltransferase